MIETIETGSPQVVGLKLSGTLHDDDYKRFVPMMECIVIFCIRLERKQQRFMANRPPSTCNFRNIGNASPFVFRQEEEQR